MDTTTVTPEDATYRLVTVWALLAAIVGTLIVFVLVTRDAEHREQVRQETRACQMEAVRGGASLGMAEKLCGKV